MKINERLVRRLIRESVAKILSEIPDLDANRMTGGGAESFGVAHTEFIRMDDDEITRATKDFIEAMKRDGPGLIYEFISFLDPTGLTDIPALRDAYNAYQKNKTILNGIFLVLAAIACIPLLGKIGKVGKVFKVFKPKAVKEVYDTTKRFPGADKAMQKLGAGNVKKMEISADGKTLRITDKSGNKYDISSGPEGSDLEWVPDVPLSKNKSKINYDADIRELDEQIKEAEDFVKEMEKMLDDNPVVTPNKKPKPKPKQPDNMLDWHKSTKDFENKTPLHKHFKKQEALGGGFADLSYDLKDLPPYYQNRVSRNKTIWSVDADAGSLLNSPNPKIRKMAQKNLETADFFRKKSDSYKSFEKALTHENEKLRNLAKSVEDLIEQGDIQGAEETYNQIIFLIDAGL